MFQTTNLCVYIYANHQSVYIYICRLRTVCSWVYRITLGNHWDMNNPGWWYTYPSEKYEFVSWDYEFPNIWKVIKAMFQTSNQFCSHQLHQI